MKTINDQRFMQMMYKIYSRNMFVKPCIFLNKVYLDEGYKDTNLLPFNSTGISYGFRVTKTHPVYG